MKGSTPLSRAAAQGHLECVVRLLGESADVNLGGETGDTPLHQAAQNGHLEICKLLLKNHAKPLALGYKVRHGVYVLLSC